jgi:hypothetical protein
MSWSEIMLDNKPTEKQIKKAERLLEEKYGDITQPIYTMTKQEISTLITNLSKRVQNPLNKFRGNNKLTPRYIGDIPEMYSDVIHYILEKAREEDLPVKNFVLELEMFPFSKNLTTTYRFTYKNKNLYCISIITQNILNEAQYISVVDNVFERIKDRIRGVRDNA